MRVTDLSGLAGAAVVIAALAMGMGRAAGLRRSGLVLLGAASAALALAPIAALPLAGFLRGATGDLSVTAFVLLVRFVLRPVFGWEPLEARTRFALQCLVTAGGLVLYPLTLGLGLWDPYRLGYGEPLFLGVLLALAVATLVIDLGLVTACLSLGVLAWSLGAYESRNLWDYLLDPLVFGWGLSALVLRGPRALMELQRRRAGGRLRKEAESSS